MVPILEREELPEALEKPKKRLGSVQVVLIQSACCAVLILLFWLFKVVGGDGYTQLRTAFHNALQNNALLATVSGLFSEDAPDESYVVGEDGVVSTTGSTTTGTTASTTPTTTTGTTVG